MTSMILFILAIAALGALAGIMQPKKKRRKRSAKKAGQKSVRTAQNRRVSKTIRTDEVILKSALNDLSGFEFERLLALYFRDQGYVVHEVGVGGNDGGVDLVIVDKRGERTAVQAKCYADHNSVGVTVVRELVAAKRNHNCVLSLLVTTSDLTQQAKKEAEQFKVDYWHGGLLEQKLRNWSKWQPTKKGSTKALSR
ncbi:restriction endonuclease [Paenibacillus sp. MWE-103]|uniref:Restriction endonuclease n=1 Tax=Paenibacillus artemisiicola TaxID=1172618 RepID=A0ABS3WA22_9BACL|nr:restriction endonuclease [Paenibacillus artemisiicola]MBO7745143.1 restriction endonuclease [Paenibacillus artemisiicola]